MIHNFIKNGKIDALIIMMFLKKKNLQKLITPLSFKKINFITYKINNNKILLNNLKIIKNNL